MSSGLFKKPWGFCLVVNAWHKETVRRRREKGEQSRGMNLGGFFQSLGKTEQEVEETEVCGSSNNSTAYNAIGWGGLGFGASK